MRSVASLRWTRVRRVAAQGLIAAAITAWLGAPASAQTLKWKFKAGESFVYALEEKVAQDTKVSDRDVKSTRAQSIQMTWTVNSLTPEGDAAITVRIDRVHLKINQPPYQAFEFDSRSDKTDQVEPFGSIAKQVKAMVGAEYTFVMKPTGAVDQFKIPPDTVKKLKEGMPAEAAAQGDFSEQALLDMLKQTNPPAFPEGELKPKQAWAAKPARINSPPLGTMVVDKSYTFQGMDAQAPSVALVDTETKVALESSDAGGFSAKIKSQQGRGRLDFDLAAGRVVATSLVQKMELSIAGPMNQVIEQTTETTSTMKLVK